MENFDFKPLFNVAKIDKVKQTIKIDKSKTIGIKLWGKIDYLVKNGYKLITSNNNTNNNNDEIKEKAHKRDLKKQSKENKRNSNMNKNKRHK